METINKVNVKQIKEDIKLMANIQKELKNQRKTVHLKGERTMEPWEATMTHQNNRNKLRVMYAAYGLIRGKSFSIIENKFPEEEHPLYEFQSSIDQIISSYSEREVENEN